MGHEKGGKILILVDICLFESALRLDHESFYQTVNTCTAC